MVKTCTIATELLTAHENSLLSMVVTCVAELCETGFGLDISRAVNPALIIRHKHEYVMH